MPARADEKFWGVDMVVGASPVLTAGGETTSKIRDIEPLLKWAAVAYGAGFLTVMLHTYRLGVPVMQLIEPIYIWVGWPLALVLYFIKQLFGFYKATRERLRLELAELKRVYETLRAVATVPAVESLLLNVIALTMNAIIGVGIPLTAAIASTIANLLVTRARKSAAKHPHPKEPGHKMESNSMVSILIREGARVLFLAQASVAFYRFGVRLLLLALVPFVCIVYVVTIYPIVPQSLGGGKATQVRLIVNARKIPADSGDLRALFPSGTLEKKPDPKPDSKPTDPDGRTTCIVTLHYETEHAYYVRHASGPIMSIDHEAVEGVIFTGTGGTGAKQQDCM